MKLVKTSDSVQPFQSSRSDNDSDPTEIDRLPSQVITLTGMIREEPRKTRNFTEVEELQNVATFHFVC